MLASAARSSYKVTVATNKEAHTMQNNIAIYNATKKAVKIVTSNLQVQNYWRTLNKNERVYVLDDVAFIDAEELVQYEHNDLLEAGWEVLQ